jgi:hypothetical protein
VKRKAFKTSPSVRIPRAAVDRLQESKAQAQAQAQATQITSLQASVSAAAHDNAIYVEGLRDAVKLIDLMHFRAGKRPLPLLDGSEVKRLEEIRLLSLGV